MYYNGLGGYKSPKQNEVKVQSMPKMRLAQAYVPPQEFKNLYSAADSLKHGTVFMDLAAASEEAWSK